MGFSSADRMSAEAWQLWKRIEVGEALPAGDWRQVLLVAEIVLVSDLVGSGLDWSITSEISPTRILLPFSGDFNASCRGGVVADSSQ